MDLLKARRLLDTGKSIFDIELRVVYYARVSTDRDEQLNSLENQTGYYENLIKTNKNWTFSGGYIDEGISGTSVNKREEFLRMIDDGMEEKFDLIITKEISRFSRSTLDSIKYTQDLLSHGVGVFFQSDNIKTLYSDSELRLTIMASLAQDEMRRLSERVKFGMRQAYENGKVLGTNNLYGYKKQDCKFIVDEETAPFIRDLFSLYASGKYGFRTITRKLTEMGYRNQQGKELNPGTLKQILINPKYKGYYHGRLTESNNYREKKSIKLPESDHLLYKDEEIPAIVSEELWERANSILKEREIKYKKKSSGTQNRFPYSGKIKCEEHGTFYYRKMWKDRKVPQEGWCCKVYLAKGRKECKSPHLYTRDLDAILAKIGEDILENKEKYQSDIDELLSMYAQTTPTRVDFAGDIKKLSSDMAKIGAKKDKILELYTDDDISKEEYLETKNKLNSELEKISQKIETLKKEQADSNEQTALLQTVQKELNDIQKSKQSALEVAQNMLKEITVLRESTEKCVKIRIDMKFPKTEQVSIIKPFILYSDTEELFMVREYGIYQQGAMFTREDFDPYKTIKYLFDSYEIELSEKLAQDIRNNKVCDEDFDYICKELEITPDERTLQSIVIHALNPVLLHDIVVDYSEETHFQNDSVYASYHTDIVGEFLFDDEDKPHKDIEDECLMVCFYVPCVWDMKDADIPADKYMASLRIKEAVKGFLKDDINWEERLGELYASGYNT